MCVVDSIICSFSNSRDLRVQSMASFVHYVVLSGRFAASSSLSGAPKATLYSNPLVLETRKCIAQLLGTSVGQNVFHAMGNSRLARSIKDQDVPTSHVKHSLLFAHGFFVMNHKSCRAAKAEQMYPRAAMIDVFWKSAIGCWILNHTYTETIEYWPRQTILFLLQQSCLNLSYHSTENIGVVSLVILIVKRGSIAIEYDRLGAWIHAGSGRILVGVLGLVQDVLE